MTTRTMPSPQLGDGVYTIPEAQRVLRLVHGDAAPTSRQLRSWLASGLTFGTAQTEHGIDVISFQDLLSLETVYRLADYLTVYRIKQLEAEIRRDFPDLVRPYANRIFYTDGQSVWMKYQNYEVEIHGRRRGNLVLREAILSFAEEIRFDHRGVATRWVPNDHIELDPTIQFGAPVLRETRITVDTITANLTIGSPAQVADWYGLPVDQVEGIASYLALN